LAPLQFLYGSGPALLFNGQEVGEPGEGIEGFGADDGRTTIYDYWTMPEFSKWVNGLRYDGARLSASQTALRNFYSALNQLCQHPAVTGDGFWGLRYFNNPSRFADCPDNLYCYARFVKGAGTVLLVVANFEPNSAMQAPLRVPPELSAVAQLPKNVEVRILLSRRGTTKDLIGMLTPDALASTGFRVAIENQSTHVYSLSGPQN
jgi:hypothetical protein